ncbi:MAG: isochorismatase family protein [Spirochaetes bacterium]|nr:isochorismatase family protein [Spirochaetota bacterium]
MWDKLKKENVFFFFFFFQEKFFPILKEKHVKLVRANILMLVKMFKELSIPMIGTDHYRKGLGVTDQKVLDIWNGPEIKDKMTFSCLGCEDFQKDLAPIDRKIAVVAGLETHICVLQTTLDLMRKGYEVIVLSDACLSSSTLKWQNGLELLKDAGAKILNTETLLFYLFQQAGSPEFKYFTKLLKETADAIK